MRAISWSRMTKTASSFITEHTRSNSHSPLLTPPLGHHRNLRVLHLPDTDTAAHTTERLNELADLAFPYEQTKRRRTR